MSPRQKRDCRVGYWWTLATAVSLILGITIAGFLVPSIYYCILYDYAYAFEARVGIVFGIAGLVVGSIVGVGQWLVVRGQIRRAVGWIWATIIGLGLGNAVGLVVLEDLRFMIMRRAPMWPTTSGDGRWTILFWAVAGALCGLILGAAQWLVFRRQVQHAGWWVVANTIGWAVAAPVGQLTGAAVADIFFRDNLNFFLFRLSPPIGDVFLGVFSAPGYLAMAIVFAAITGLVLARLLEKTGTVDRDSCS